MKHECGTRSQSEVVAYADVSMGARGLVLTSLGEHVWGHVWSQKHECGTRSHSEVVAYVDVLMGTRGLVITSLGEHAWGHVLSECEREGENQFPKNMCRY